MRRKKKNMTILDYMRQNIKWGMLGFALIFIIGIFIGPGFGSYGSMQCGSSKQPLTREDYIRQNSPVLAKFGNEEFKDYTIGREYDQRLEYYKSQSVKGSVIPPEDLIGLKWSVLDSNIESKVKMKNAVEEGIKVDSKEIEKQFNDFKQKQMASAEKKETKTPKNLNLIQRANLFFEGQKSERDFNAVLHQAGLTAQKLRENIKDNLLVQKFDEKLDKEAKDEVKAEAKKKAVTIYNRIVTDKEDFNKIAKTENDDSTSAAKDGLVENMTRKDAKAKGDAFATALFTGEIGKVQEPIETEDGDYIVKVESRILAEGPDYEAAKPGIVANLKKELGIKDEAPKVEQTQTSNDPQTKTDDKTAKSNNMETKSTETKDTQAKDPTSTEKKDEKKITDDMIKERYEKVSFRQIFVRLPSSYERVNEKVKKLKEEAGVEYVDPLMKAYSYIAGTDENKNYDKAIEGFRAIRDTKKAELEKAQAELKDANANLDSASEDQKINLESKVTAADDKVVDVKTELAQADYLIAHYMKEQIDQATQKRLQEFNDKKNKEPEKYNEATASEATPEEQKKIADAKVEMKTLLEEAVSLQDTTPEVYYNAMLGDIYVEDKEWEKAYQQWSTVVDYVVSDPNLLQRASAAYSSIMDNLTDPAKREKAGKEFDILSKNLEKANIELKKVQEEQQKRWQQMIQEQMKQQESKDSTAATDKGAGDTQTES